MRPRALFCALTGVVLLSFGSAQAATASTVIKPDINGATPRARLSPSGTRSALKAVAGQAKPGSIRRYERHLGDLPFFLSDPFNVQLLPPGQRTLYFLSDALIPLVDTGVHDADGVRMFDYQGQLWNHVSQQAGYGLDNINAYRITRDVAYLVRAEAQAQRLINRAVDVGGASFHPYDFVWGAMQPPWCSGLGQGFALSLFTRLYELTGDGVYKTAAEKTFASFLIAGPVHGSWIADVDPSGHLWLQEYPDTNLACVYNGQMVAALALYDYWRVTADQRALALFDGAATTVLDYAASFRQAGWRSLYCLVDPITASPAYHEVVVQQLLALFTITRDPRFARLADGFENDYSRDAVSGTATLAAGKHTVFKFVTPGKIVAQRTISSTTMLHLKVSLRRRVQGRPGYWLEIASGAFRGYWIQEWAPQVFVPGELVTLNYSPTRTLTLPAGGSYVFRRYAPDGTVTSTMALTASNDTTVQVTTRAIVNGMPQVCASDGPFAGYWIRLRGCSLT